MSRYQSRWTASEAALVALLFGPMVWLGLTGGCSGSAEPVEGRVGAYCEDGTYSAATGNGACSGHGGVDYWDYGDDGGADYPFEYAP